jgi:hypothetical protein
MISSTFRSFAAVCVCLFLGLHTACFWQGCWLSKSSLPPLLGFRLGMSREELENRFAGLKVKTDSYTELFISGSKTLPGNQDVSAVDEIGHVSVNVSRFPEFEDISTLRLKLEDGRVFEIELTYPDESRWKSEEEFLAFVAQTLHLPDRRYWKPEPRPRYGVEGASVSCNGLTVRAGFHLIIGSAPGGPGPIAFPFVVVADDNVSRKAR